MQQLAESKTKPTGVAVCLCYKAVAKIPQQCLEAEILTAILQQADIPTVLYDPNFERRAPGTPLVLFYFTFQHEFQIAKSLLVQWSGQHYRPRVIISGVFADLFAEQVLKDLADWSPALLRGEPEPQVAQLASALLAGHDGTAVPGTSWLDGAQVRQSPNAVQLADPGMWPMASPLRFHLLRCHQGQHILVSKGCNSDCTYCGFQTPNRKLFPGRHHFWRMRPVNHIVAEITTYRKRGIKHFIFNSHVFFGYTPEDAARIRELCISILEHDLDISFFFFTHPGALARNAGLLPLLKKAGLRSLGLGLDTGLKRVRQLFGLEFGQAEIHQALQVLADHQVPFDTSFIFYDPYLSFQEIKENLHFLRQIAPYYRHQKKGFPYYLEHQFLNTQLILRPQMPIFRQLVADGLAREVDPLSQDPAFSFRSPQVAKFRQVQRNLLTFIMGRNRDILSRPDLPPGNAEIATVPLDLLAYLHQLLEHTPDRDAQSLERDCEKWWRQEIEPLLARLAPPPP